MSIRKQKIIDVIQWILIISLIGVCAYIYFGNNSLHEKDKEIRTEKTYLKIYESQKIHDLEKINKLLYDSITVLKNVESAVEIKYIYTTKTDTIRETEFVYSEDSVYHYSSSNDTIHTEIDIKANNLQWCKVNTNINDRFTIINQENNNKVSTKINHSNNMDIINVDTWHKKKGWKDRIYYGPTINFGYGLIHNKIDVTVGFGVGMRF